MSRRKSPIAGLRYYQPCIGFVAHFRAEPVEGNSEDANPKVEKPRRGPGRRRRVPRSPTQGHKIHLYNDCREGLIWDLKEIFQDHVVEWARAGANSWTRVPVVSHTIDLESAALKQPGRTYLFMGDEEDYPNTNCCARPCCIDGKIETLDALVGPLAVLLNNDRYVGNWWTTNPEESTQSRNEIRWYGTDNFFLRHSTLLSLMMGMFRQALLLFQQNLNNGLLKAVRRKDVEDCLTNADPELAMRILTRLRPWIEVPCGPHMGVHYPFPRGHWSQLRLLHRAIYKHGYDEVFGMNVEASWQMGAQGRYEVPSGPRVYWGRDGSRPNAATKRLAKLGK